NPFDLYTDPTKARSTSQRGLSYRRDTRPPGTFPWIDCPGRFENQSFGDPDHPGSTLGGYGYEAPGAQPLSTIDPLFSGGSPWADFWMVNNIHYVDRNLGFADGHAVFQERAANHTGSCPQDVQ